MQLRQLTYACPPSKLAYNKENVNNANDVERNHPLSSPHNLSTSKQNYDIYFPKETI